MSHHTNLLIAGQALIKSQKKINDWNYVIEIKGERKVISISKMRHYKANKYTPKISAGDESETKKTSSPSVSTLQNPVKSSQDKGPSP